MKVQGTHETPQEIGGVGHSAIVVGKEHKSVFIQHLTCYAQVACSERQGEIEAPVARVVGETRRNSRSLLESRK